MAANINDKITKTFDTVNPNVAKVTADRAPGSTTLQANNLAGWTEVTAEHFSTYRVDAQNKLIEGSQTDWKGIVNKATNTITNLTRIGGAEDSGSLVNDIIQAGPTAKWADDLADGILVTHNADGTLKNKVVALTNINGSYTAGLLKSDASGNVTVGKATSDDLDYATSVDANGWTVHDYGNWKEYLRSNVGSPNTSLPAFMGSSYTLPAIKLPVGVATLAAVNNISYSLLASDRIFAVVIRSNNMNAATSIQYNIANNYNTAVALTWYRIDTRLVVWG